MVNLDKRIPILSIILLFLLGLCWFSAFWSSMKLREPEEREIRDSLQTNGYQLLPNIFQEKEIAEFVEKSKSGKFREIQDHIQHHHQLLRRLRDCIFLSVFDENPNYIFQDYIWIIQKSVVHTCHRDNNGDFFNMGQKYPSYTVLIYLEDMNPSLGVFPGSHQDQYTHAINLFEKLTPVSCKKGDVIIFNANLIHTGMFNDYKKEDHLRIQMKFTHRDDIDKIAYYENFHKIQNRESTLPIGLRKIHQSVSCTFPIVSDWTQGENIRTARGTDNGIDIGWAQQAFSYLLYGNADFYDLPNAY